jgi:hypothetical protein
MSDKYPGGFVTAGAPAGFSVAFDGTGDYLNIAATSAFAWGTGDLTIECWVYLTSSTADSGIWDFRNADSNQLFLRSTSTSSLQLYVNSASQYTFSITANAWNHVAVVRSSSTLVTYVNGVQVGTVANSNNFSTNSPCSIGGFYNGSGLITGYVSNLRAVKGTAVYTSAFTPPTQLFPITNTSLLTCQSPTIIDNSTNALTITANGDAKVSNFTPFAGYQGFNPALGAAAGGVWTIDESAYYQQNRLWPIYDPYFNQTTLMLHGNGTNAAQNNTFLDSSTNNFTITRNGNTTQGTFTPFSQTGWSNYLTSAGLSVPYAAALQLENTNWTIEAYFNLSSASAEFCLMGASNGGGGVPKYFMGGNWSTSFVYAANRATFFTYTGGNRFIDVPFTWEIGRWYHMAAVYTHSNTTTTLYINGVSVGSMVYGIGNVTGNVLIGRNGENGGPINGDISNFRYIVGTSLYTANFTPQTTPLTAITNTQILTCQSNSFIDNSGNSRAISIAAGTPSVQAFSPFVPAYITPTTYSNFFDGSTGYLSFTSSAGIAFGTGDYTVEAWVNLTTSATYQTLFGSATSDALMFNIYSMNSVVIQTSGTNIFATFSGATFATNTWYHVAVSRSSGTVKAFVNGVQYGSTITSNTTNYAQPTTNTIGSNAASQYFGGCLSNLRLVKGTAVYTANFTPPTAPLTNITNTSLLTCQNSTFIDNSSSPFTLTATGTVQPVTSPTPFPAKVDTTTLNSAYSTSLIGGSGSFDGTGDSLILASNSAFNLSTGDFTIDGWVWFNQTADQGGGGQCFIAGTTAAYPVIYISTNGGTTLSFAQNSTVIVSGTIQKKAWNHIAVARSGSSIRFFVNGALAQTATYSTAIDFGGVYVGVQSIGGVIGYLDGYMSGLRIIKGTCLYTQSFAPPIEPPTAVANTQLLLNYTNGAVFDNTAKNTLETGGNAQISTTQSKYGGSSMYFDGTGDYLVGGAFSAPLRAFGTGDFTIEGWFYTGANKTQIIVDTGTTSGSGSGMQVALNSSGYPYFFIFNSITITSSIIVNVGTWTHVAWVRSGGVATIYVNGVSGVSTANTSNITDTGLTIGTPNDYRDASATFHYNGYIDDLRITRGYARYITNFTPPTSQLQDQ